MTFTQLVDRIMDRLNLTSADATTRIGERVNEAYKDVTSAIGMETARRVMTTVVVNPLIAPYVTSLPEITFSNMEKVLRIQLITDGVPRTLDEVTYDDATDWVVRDGVPYRFAVKRIGYQSVTIILDGYTADASFTLKVEGYEIADTLSGTMSPSFPESFHDVIMEHVLMNEYRKMERTKDAEISMARYEHRLSDLRMFIAKSAFLVIQQGGAAGYRYNGQVLLGDRRYW